MNRLRSEAPVVALVALCATLGPKTLHANDRPYRATETSVLVSEAPSPACGPGQVLVQIEGRGVATHLGAYTAVRQHCFDFALSAIQAGAFTFTAANGDVVSGTYAGELVFTPGGSILIDVSWEITGGTGRFAGASGSGLSHGTFDPTTQQATTDDVGVIVY
jgi:hypothetical protein